MSTSSVTSRHPKAGAFLGGGRRRIVILGGGMAGLAAAWRLSDPEGEPADITVYQRGWRLGGAIGVCDRGADEIIHELELAANRHRKAGQLGLFGGFRGYRELRHPDRVSGPRGRTLEPSFSVRAG